VKREAKVEADVDEQVYIGLCHRCEHRAVFYETGRRPRMECGDVGRACSACYMFHPVVPLVLQAMDPKDSRPLFGPAVIASRVVSHRKAETKATAMPLGKGEFLVVCVPSGKDLLAAKQQEAKTRTKYAKKIEASKKEGK
jgi:hypothetical protein